MNRTSLLCLWVLAGACQADTPQDGPPPEDSASPADRDTGRDTGDATTPDPLDVAPGPDCRPEEWPLETPWNVLAAHVVAGQASAAMVEDVRTLVAFLQGGGERGPWEDEVQGPLVSADGVDFGDRPPDGVIAAASVPAVTVGPEGDLWLFYVDADLNRLLEAAETGTPLRSGIVGVGGLGAARSTDGSTFSPVEISFEGDVPLYIVDPDITALPDGTWRMTYFGVPADRACADHLDPAQSALPHQAYTAVSSDLVTWTQEDVAWTAPGRGSDPTVWCADASRCWLYMGGGAVSTDGGQTYTAVDMQLPAAQVTTPDVFAVPGGWRMLYVDGTQLSAAVSSDGLTWTPDGGLPFPGADPTVVEHDGDLWLYVKGKPPTEPGEGGGPP